MSTKIHACTDALGNSVRLRANDRHLVHRG